MQRTDLVMHQGYQRRDNDSDAVPRVLPGNGRDLITQRLSAARGHQHQRVAAFDHVINDGFLRAAKVRITENFAKYVERRRVR